MNCPYCGEDIDEHTAHCRLCGADLTLILPLVGQIERLTQRVAALEKRSALEAELAEPVAEAKPSAAVPALLFPSISEEWAVTLGVIGIALVHYAVVVVFDARLTVLLAGSILFPFCAGFLRRGLREHGVLRVIGGALVLALVSLAEMSLVTRLFFQVPIAPQDPHDWRELVNFGGLIAAGYLIGALLRGLIRFWYVGRGRVLRRRGGIVYRTLRALGSLDPDMLERSEKLFRQLEYTVMNVTALVASIYFLVDHLQPALGWLRSVKP